MKSTDKVYLDYNATSPLDPGVRDFISGPGSSLFGNPSSIHRSGKQSRRVIDNSRSYLFRTFGMDPQVYDLFFHSCATEGINTILYNWLVKQKRAKFHGAVGEHTYMRCAFAHAFYTLFQRNEFCH